jgi:hypothetical protein
MTSLPCGASELHDYVDGDLGDDRRAMVEQHLTACSACRDLVVRITALAAEVAAAPRAVEPPGDLWPAIRAEIVRRSEGAGTAGGSALTPPTAAPAAATEVAVAPRPGRRGPPERSRIEPRIERWRRTTLAAAAVLLVAASSAATALWLRGSAPAPVAAGASGGAGRADRATPVAPAVFARLDAGYERAARDLAATLDAERGSLAPETIAKVEASLRVVDSAIAEGRAALERDPGNQTVVQLLAVSYRQKLDVLRRATELSTGI